MIAAEPQISPAPVVRPTTGRPRRSRLTPSLAAVLCVVLYLGIITTEGASRWILSQVGLEPLLYLRDLLPIAGIFFSAMMPALSRWLFVFTVISLQLALAAAVGYIHWGSIPQVVFGVKVFLPLLFGLAVYPAIMRNWEFFCRGCAVLFAIAVFGICLNTVVHYPWIGSEFTIGNVTVEGSREWTELDGRDRIPGFARLSSEAALHVVFFLVFMLAGTRSSLRRFVLSALAGYAVYLTTSKTSLVSLTLMLVNYALLEGVPMLRSPRPGSGAGKLKALAVYALRLQIFAYVLITVILPLNMSGTLGFLQRDLREGSQFHLLSMQDRASLIWPIAMEHIQKVGGPWFGAGAGGVGAPLEVFGKAELPVTCDNAFIYAYGVMGVFLVPYLVIFLYFIFTPRIVAFRGSAIIGLITLLICTHAVTGAVFEQIYDCFFVGFVIAHSIFGWRMRSEPAKSSLKQSATGLPKLAAA